MSTSKGLTLTASALALTFAWGAASAQTTNLRMRTHFSQETLSGQLAGEFVEDVTEMSNGDIRIEMFHASSVVASSETLDAAATGILDCDMTGGSCQTGKNPAFQFAGDLNGACANPYHRNAENAVALAEKGIDLHAWSEEDMQVYRNAVRHASLPNRSNGCRWSFDLRHDVAGQSTSRDHLPGFVARSRNDPASELGDWRAWKRIWENTRAALADSPHVEQHRWPSHGLHCA